MEKTQWIRDIDAGDDVRSLFLVSAASQLQAKNGPFWKLELKDASGCLEARIWSPASQSCPDVRAGSLAEVEGRAESYRDQLQINVGRLRLLTAEETEQADLAAFLPAGDRPAADLLEEAEALCRRELTHKPWRAFALAVLGDPEIRPRLLTATAAKGVHHAWVGGLLEHSLSVATLCLRLCDHYPELDRQTLFTGALFHDIGKIAELSGGSLGFQFDIVESMREFGIYLFCEVYEGDLGFGYTDFMTYINIVAYHSLELFKCRTRNHRRVGEKYQPVIDRCIDCRQMRHNGTFLQKPAFLVENRTQKIVGIYTTFHKHVGIAFTYQSNSSACGVIYRRAFNRTHLVGIGSHEFIKLTAFTA